MPNILLGGGPGTATQSMTLQAYIDWNTLNLGRSAAVAYLLLLAGDGRGDRLRQPRSKTGDGGGMNNPFRRRSATDLSSPAKFVAFLLLVAWALVVLFPIYWLIVTSFKTPYDVDKGPFYVPFVDFQPTLDAWRYILVDLGNDTLRPYINTVIVGLTSSAIALVMGSLRPMPWSASRYRPKLGLIGVGIGCIAFAFVTAAIGAPLPIAITAAVAIFLLLAQTIGRRFRRTLANSDIAFWLISQRILPPIAVGDPAVRPVPAGRAARQLAALVITYVAANLPIVVWLMRDYFASLPRELEESAAVDGASVYRIVRSIVLPISIPGLVATFLIVLIFAWNEFLIALVLTSANAQTMPLQVAAQNATRGPQWWAMSVLILIMIAPVVVMAIALERYITRGHPRRCAEGLTVGTHHRRRRPRRPLPDVAHARRLRRDEPRSGLLGRVRRPADRRRRRPRGHGLTFTIGRGNEVVVAAIDALAPLVVGPAVEALVADMGAFWRDARRRQPAALDRPREGRHPPRDRGRRQRRLGPVGQAGRQAAVAARWPT